MQQSQPFTLWVSQHDGKSVGYGWKDYHVRVHMEWVVEIRSNMLDNVLIGLVFFRFEGIHNCICPKKKKRSNGIRPRKMMASHQCAHKFRGPTPGEKTHNSIQLK